MKIKMQVKKVKFYELKKKDANGKKMNGKKMQIKKVASFLMKNAKKGGKSILHKIGPNV